MIFPLFKFARPNAAAGAAIFAINTGKILLQLRSDHVSNGGTWSLVGGGIEPGEAPEQAMFREIAEETGAALDGNPMLVHVYRDGPFRYYSFLLPILKEFIPVKNFESSAHKWFTVDDFPEPLHPGLADILPGLKKAILSIKTI